MSAETVEIARAKVNLTLHVGAVIKDPHDPFFDYHPLDSLVMFADIGDEVRVRCTGKGTYNTATLDISGAHASALSDGADNLILRAYRLVATQTVLPAMEFSLVKNLPVAAGLGGGSANAAAVLRLLQNYADLSEETWHGLALQLGADVPVCLLSQTARMTGIGERVSAIETDQKFHAVLANPGVAVSTRDIFKAFDASTPLPEPHPHVLDAGIKLQMMEGNNDLEAIAISHVPEIKTVLESLKLQRGCYLARMSGSGASCFGLFEMETEAHSAVERLRLVYPEWWSYNANLGHRAVLS